ncbi:hypothetical protein QTG54_003915 [Skeletonema marinoi]|uniref:Uncharacterized protein n=1 Tax=Skeletonema marinoi TaxID=267567 RepID=A0AAD9DFN8_9STRA|nr:hypothetical protein QTG54_003915 [Skeletonema marinoi]
MTSGEVEEHQNQHVDENDDDVAETSPESAALVRGASRSVATAGKGAMVGRLPMPSKAASTAVSKASRVRPAVRARPAVRSVPPRAPRSMPRAPRGSARLTSKIPKGRRANTIAKVSDRASNIFDVVSAGSESTSTDGNDGSTKKMSERQASSLQKLKSMLPTFQQTISFSRVFAVNTVLGMAVYGTYEGLIDRYAPVAEHSDEPNIHVLNNGTGQIYTGSEELADENDDAMERATLPQHFMAGGLGGASHAILSLGLEMKVHNKSTIPQQGMNHNIANATIMNKIHLQYPTMNYSLSSLFHHSMAHAILFGSYQTTKRMLLSNITLPNNNNNYDISHAVIISTAGGIAGQLQHVTSHISEQYLGISGPRVPSFRHLTWPTLRSTLLAFPMSSIGFVAFEYGKLMMNADESTE